MAGDTDNLVNDESPEKRLDIRFADSQTSYEMED